MSSPALPPHRSVSSDTEIEGHDKEHMHKEGAYVLVVDDDFNTRQSLRRQLKAADFHVQTAADGVEALAILDEQNVDVVILDVKMPCMDGFEVCQTIKRTRDIPVIFLTGAQNQMIREYLPQMVDGAGGDHFLRKPCDTRELIRLIHEVLNKR